MPAVLDKASKQEEFVEKQIEQARARIRTLDYFSAGLTLLIGSLAFLLAVLLVDRYVETPTGAGWPAVGLYLVGAAGFLYWSLFRPSRRHINPFYVAVKVEQQIPDAKNSVVNYVDLKDDEKVPGSVKTAIGTKAAKDLKHVDLARAIQKKQIVWLAVLAGLFFVAALVVAFLPPTRTSLTLLSPKDGNATVDQGTDVRIEAEIRGYLPEKGQPGSPVVRLWYNPDDPGTYEERPLEQVEDQRHVYGLTIPAKQVRNGFQYRITAGKVQTPDYEIKVRIIPQFQSWEVQYQYPTYLKREPEKTGDPNLVGYYGTLVTVTAHTNRPVRSGELIIDNQIETVPGELVDGTPEAVRFQFRMLRNTTYRIKFVTTDGEKNPDPQRFRIALIDPKPALLRYDVTYDFPKYLRYDPNPLVIPGVKDPHLEAMRGTKVTLLASANREVKSAAIQFPGADQPIAGEKVEGQPTQVKFTLPPLDVDGAYRVVFAPATDEKESDGRVFNVRVQSDDKPKVVITKPEAQEVELPANGTLSVEGLATDDIGLEKMTLHMQVVTPAPARALAPRPYREGKSFRREADDSYPTRIDYKDLVELAKVKPEGEAGAGFKVEAGMVIEYWLEATDNCRAELAPAPGKAEKRTIGPNSNYSEKKRLRILPPETAADKQKKQEQARQELEREKKQHEQQQDQRNANEKRDPKAPPQQQQQPQQGGQDQGEPKEGATKKDGAKKDGNPMGGMPGDPMGDPGANDEELRRQEEELKRALGEKAPKTDPKADPKTAKGGKGEPADEPKAAKNGGDPQADPAQLPKPEDFEKLADKLESDDPKERAEAREQLKQLMDQAKKEPPKPQDAEKKLDEHQKKLTAEQKEKFEKAMEKLAQEMQNLQREEQVQKAAEKAASDDPMERAEGQKQIQDLMKNPKTRKDVERQLQNLAGGQTEGERKRRIDDALDLSRKEQAKNDPPTKDETPPEPMPKKEDVDELAKNINKGNEREKQEAQDRLEKMMKKDKATRDQVQKQLDDFKKNLKDDQARQNFEQSMKQIEQNLGKQDGANNKPSAEDVEKFAKQLTSENESERKDAKQKLEDALKKTDNDPKAREQAQQQLKDVRDGIKDEKKKEQFDRAMQDIGKAVEQHRQEQTAARQKEVEQLAKDLNSKDPKAQQGAQQKLEEMMRDPQDRAAVKEQLDKLKDGTKDQATRDNIDNAVKKAEEKLTKKDGAGEKGPKQDEVDKLARDLNSDNAETRKNAQQKLDEMMRDPKTRDAVREKMEKARDGAKGNAEKKTIDEAMRKAEQDVAAKDAEAQRKEELEQLAKDLNSKDAGKRQAAQEKLQEMMRDPKERNAVKDQLDKIKDGLGDDAAKKNIDDAVAQAQKELAKKDVAKKDGKAKKGGAGSSGGVKPEDVAKLADKLQNGTSDEKQQAQKDLEKMLQDPKTRAQVEKELEKIRNGAKGEAEKKALDDALKQAKDAVAKGAGKDAPKKDDVTKKEPSKAEPTVAKEDLEKIVKGLNSKDPKDVQAAKKALDDIMKDPQKRTDYDKQLAEMLKDPKKRQEFRDATKELVKDELKKIGNQLKSGKPEEKEAAQRKLEELMDKAPSRELAREQVEEFKNEIEDKELRDEFDRQFREAEKALAKKDAGAKAGKKGDDLGKHPMKPGGNTNQESEPGATAELRNKTKAGELLLEEFKKNITNEEFVKQLGWSEEQIARFMRNYERQLADLKKRLEMEERGEIPPPRPHVPPKLPGGVEKIKLGAKDGADPLQGGRYTAPPGFTDPYKQFTEAAAGIKRPEPAAPAGKK